MPPKLAPKSAAIAMTAGRKPSARRAKTGRGPSKTPPRDNSAASGKPKATSKAKAAASSASRGAAQGRDSQGRAKPGAKGRPKAAPKPRRKARPLIRRLAWPLVRLGLVAAVWGVIVLLGALAWFAHDLPDPETEARVTRRPAVTLLAADGRTLARFGDIVGAPLQAREAPAVLVQAVLATEDRRFFSHPGIDPLGILRAAWVNLRAGRVAQGGSTITQQVAKTLFLGPERTLRRKIQEALLALWLERVFTKDQILTLYLNRIYLGAGTTGVDAAARRYFDRPATALSLYQAAVIAGLPKAPSRLNPASNPKGAHARALEVLDNMVEAGWLTKAEARAAVADRGHGADASLARARRSLGGGYFADWVMARLEDFVGTPDRDLVVHTTLDPALQRAAEQAVRATLNGGEAADKRASQAALVALDGAGAVRAMVGGLDHARSPFNRAAQARRQPGSAFKPFVFLAALEAGLSPDSRVLDAPVAVGDWRPGNYAGRYRGEVTLRQAMALSLNSAAVRLSQRVGPARVARVARRLGVGGTLKAHPAIALGVAGLSPLDLVAGYLPLANGGLAALPHGIRAITDGEGRVLYRRQPGGRARVVAPEQVEAMDALLRAVVVWGTGQAAALPAGLGTARGKTGTSQDYRDAWFVGYVAGEAPSPAGRAALVAAAWVGNDDNSPMKGVTGGGLPAEVWRRFMEGAGGG